MNFQIENLDNEKKKIRKQNDGRILYKDGYM